MLKVTRQTISAWTKNQRALGKFEGDVKSLSLYLAGRTQESIAEEMGEPQQTIDDRLKRFRTENEKILQFGTILNKENPDDDTKARQSVIKRYLGNHLLDPTQPPPSLKVYDVWNFPKCDEHYGGNYPGRIPGQIVENLLWYYTEHPDKVVPVTLKPLSLWVSAHNPAWP